MVQLLKILTCESWWRITNLSPTSGKYSTEGFPTIQKRSDTKGRPCTRHLFEGCVIGVGVVRSADHNVTRAESSSGPTKEIQLRRIGANPRLSRRSIYDVEMEHSCSRLSSAGRRQGGRGGCWWGGGAGQTIKKYFSNFNSPGKEGWGWEAVSEDDKGRISGKDGLWLHRRRPLWGRAGCLLVGEQWHCEVGTTVTIWESFHHSVS